MGRKNSKIPGQRMEIQKGSQKEVKQYNRLSAEDKEKLKNTTLNRYEEYINSDREKKEQIILQILAECRLANSPGNRYWIAIYIRNENQKRERDKISAEDKEKLKNTTLNRYEEYINSNAKKKKQIILQILKDCELVDNPGNRYWIINFIKNENQKCERDKNKISAEDKEKLKNTTLQHYEEYINSDREKREQIILQILKDCELVDNSGNRHWIAIYISNENQKRNREKIEISAEDKKKLKNTILEYYERYNDPNCNREEKEQIISQILEKCGLVYNPGNRSLIIRSMSNENQKCKREKIEISAENKEKLKNTTLQHYEEYINSDIEKKKQIILQILAECGLDDDSDNRYLITKFISNEKQKRESKKKKTPMPTEKPKHYNRLSLLILEEINSFIIKNDLHTKYLETENKRGKKADIINTILNEYKIEDYPKNRKMIKRLILQQTFKPWSDKEEKALEELLCNKINMAVWNESGDDNKIMQARKQILDDFNEMAPGNEHNEQDIMHKMRLLACKIKNTASKPIEAEQIEPVQQAVSKVIGKEMRLNKADEKLCNQSLEELSDFGIDIDMFENHENCPEF